MFASLKSKIKEETGSDISKLTSSWRAGTFLGRISMRDESTTTTTTPSSSVGLGDTSTSESISPQLESYLSDRTGGQIDQSALTQQYTGQLEDKLRERDAFWERKIEELKLSVTSVQGSEAAAAQAVARSAQQEAARAAAASDAASAQLADLRGRLAAAEAAQDRLDQLTEEMEQSQRLWSRERAQCSAQLGEAEARAQDLADQLAQARARLPTDDPMHHVHEDDKRELTPSGCADFDRVCRERAVLSRQLQEAKMALADVKTSWSGQIASLETQDNAMDLQLKLDDVLRENKELVSALENERTLLRIVQEKVEKSSRLYDEQRAEVLRLSAVLTDVRRKMEKEKREKDEAYIRNAQISQSLEMSQCEVRYQESELAELRTRIQQLEGILAQHKENQAACMLIKESEETRNSEIEALQRRVQQLTESEAALRNTTRELETEICDKNKKIKTLDNRISDMKKTLQRELQTSKTDHSAQEEQDISRRYLKHVVLRFLTARELEARQLTRALSVLLRLSAHEEALLRAALPPRQGISAWFPSLNTNT